MKLAHVLGTTSLLTLLCAPVGAAVQTKEVSYEANGLTMKGFLAWDDAKKGPRPGVLVVHEWWGHNDYVRGRAKQLAAMGYVALAVDMYGDGKTADHPKTAGEFAAAVMSEKGAAAARFNAARKALEADPHTDKKKIAAVGYCFGGGVVLEMARSGQDLAGVASFHGSLGTKTPAQKGAVKAKVFVAHGEADPFISAEVLAGFQKEMKDAGVNLEFHSYPGAKHGFTSPEATENGKKFKLPLEYHAEADKKSWAELDAFLKKVTQ